MYEYKGDDPKTTEFNLLELYTKDKEQVYSHHYIFDLLNTKIAANTTQNILDGINIKTPTSVKNLLLFISNILHFQEPPEFFTIRELVTASNFTFTTTDIIKEEDGYDEKVESIECSMLIERIKEKFFSIFEYPDESIFETSGNSIYELDFRDFVSKCEFTEGVTKSLFDKSPTGNKTDKDIDIEIKLSVIEKILDDCIVEYLNSFDFTQNVFINFEIQQELADEKLLNLECQIKYLNKEIKEYSAQEYENEDYYDSDSDEDEKEEMGGGYFDGIDYMVSSNKSNKNYRKKRNSTKKSKKKKKKCKKIEIK